MGCCESRKPLESRFEDSLFTPFEKRIGLNKFQFSDIDSLLSQYSKLPHMSYFQVSSLFETLSLPFQDYLDFYNQFDRNLSQIVAEKKFSYLQLQSLNVLICKGDLKSKLRFLFDLYDLNSQRILLKRRLEEMLENLLKVALDYVPGYFLIKTPDNTDLSNYQKVLKIGNDILLDRISSKILKTKKIVGLDEFLCNALKFFGKNLLSTEYLRERAYYFGVNGKQEKKSRSKKLTIESKRESKELWMDDLSDVSNELISVIQPRQAKPEVKFSEYYPRADLYFSEDGMDGIDKKVEIKAAKSSSNSPKTQRVLFSESPVTNKLFISRSTYPKNFTCFTNACHVKLAEIKSDSDELPSPAYIKRNSTKDYLSLNTPSISDYRKSLN